MPHFYYNLYHLQKKHQRRGQFSQTLSSWFHFPIQAFLTIQMSIFLEHLDQVHVQTVLGFTISRMALPAALGAPGGSVIEPKCLLWELLAGSLFLA